MMTLSMLAAAFAGCLSDNDESNFDEADIWIPTTLEMMKKIE